MKRTFGVERERFIVNKAGQIVPEIEALLPVAQKLAKINGLPEELFSYELFAGQIEDRTLPCFNLGELRSAMVQNDKILAEAADLIGLALESSEIIKGSKIKFLKANSLDKRHKKIWRSIALERKIAASVVAATHIHISVAENEVTRILNICRKDVIDRLIEVGDHSGGKRMAAYRIMAETEGVPPMFLSFDDVMNYIKTKGGERNVWDLVRYKPSTGTIEFRMFGATQSVEEVIGYVRVCLGIVMT